MTLKEITNVRFLPAVNPKAGAFFIVDRLQWHCGVYACCMPEKTGLRMIYGQILAGHLMVFGRDIRQLKTPLTEATIKLHHGMTYAFLPTAIKLRYQWNLREMSYIGQGIMQCSPAVLVGAKIVRLWLHEGERTLADRMTTDDDKAQYHEMATGICRQFFAENVNLEEVFMTPNLWGPFATSPAGDDNTYDQCQDYDSLGKLLNQKLSDYNTDFAAMNLVLFNQASLPTPPYP